VWVPRAFAKDELLAAHAQTIAVRERSQCLDGHAVQVHAISTSQVLHDRTIGPNDDPRMTPGDQWIVDRHVAVDSAADDRGPEREVDLVEEESQAAARHEVARGKSMDRSTETESQAPEI